jgi:hypothetical protein
METEFNKKNLLKLKKMTLEELNSYYRMLRKYEYETNKPLDSSKLKKKIHSLTMLILKIDRITTGRKLILFDDKRTNNFDTGKIFAASHVGRYDIESTMEAINCQAYFVMGDPGETYRNFEGFFLSKMHGRICVDTGYQIFDIIRRKKEGKIITPSEQEILDEYKLDRHICEEVCTNRIINGDNILIYPEGAWNVTDRLTQSLFPGTARIAINGNGIIIPVGIIREGKTYTVNIGSELDISGAQINDVQDITDELKELINSLKGEIIFSDSKKIISRSSLKSPLENEQDNINDIMSETTNGYTLDVIEKSRYYDYNYPENVFTKKLSRRV